jgi:hypothetical protein
VTAQVGEIAQACEAVAAGMSHVGTTVEEMNGLVDGIAAVVDGSASLATDGGNITGLSQMAERLRPEAIGLLGDAPLRPGACRTRSAPRYSGRGSRV